MASSDALKSTELPAKRVIFLHPDLGIGGAERLVVDAAVGLQEEGCKVTIFTSHCDKSHCFTECRDGTLDVRVRGNSIFPPNIGGRFAIFCAIARQVHLILSIALFSNELASLRPTHFFVDQLSAGVPLLRLLCSNTKILFYCHFPDKLLAQRGSGLLWLLKAIYRVPFNLLEAWSTNCSDDIVVNSKFTGGVVKSAFSILRSRKLKVIYPCVDTEIKKSTKSSAIWPDRTLILSINRFQRQKGVDLAIRAFAKLSAQERAGCILVLAGGYDPRLIENVEYLKELQQLADKSGLKSVTLQGQADLASVTADTSIVFLPSVPDNIKQTLLDSTTLLLYTPRNEHFGIVPLEAMLNEVPVLAANEGGPLETVVEGETGWLRDVAKPDDWTLVMQKVIAMKKNEPQSLARMGQAGRARVQDKFSKKEMALRLDDAFDRLATAKRPAVVNQFVIFIAGFTVVAGIMGVVLTRVLLAVLAWDTKMEQQAAARRAAQ